MKFTKFPAFYQKSPKLPSKYLVLRQHFQPRAFFLDFQLNFIKFQEFYEIQLFFKKIIIFQEFLIFSIFPVPARCKTFTRSKIFIIFLIFSFFIIINDFFHKNIKAIIKFTSFSPEAQDALKTKVRGMFLRPKSRKSVKSLNFMNFQYFMEFLVFSGNIGFYDFGAVLRSFLYFLVKKR